MGAADKFLSLTHEQAMAQWLTIQNRVIRTRQDPFMPVETLLAFGLFYLFPSTRYGGGSIHLAPTAVHDIAKTCVRPPSSFTQKMLNLDGHRANGQMVEPELFLALSGNPVKYTALYRIVIGAARAVGLGPDRVPDFLGLEQQAASLFPLRPVNSTLEFNRDDEAVAGKLQEQLQIGTADSQRMVSQQLAFADHRLTAAVLDLYDGQCAFCGIRTASVPRTDLVTAARIKPSPFADSKEFEDVYNAVAACVMHAKAFAQGWLGVGESGVPALAPALARDVAENPPTARAFGPGALLARVVQAEGQNARERFLRWHRERVFKTTA